MDLRVWVQIQIHRVIVVSPEGAGTRCLSALTTKRSWPYLEGNCNVVNYGLAPGRNIPSLIARLGLS